VIDHTLPYADIRKDLQAYANSSTPSEGVDPKSMRIFTKEPGGIVCQFDKCRNMSLLGECEYNKMGMEEYVNLTRPARDQLV
jgi:hypothetical protein